MKLLNRTRPRLEILEDRFCPTLSVVQSGSTLLISGTPVNPGGTLGLVVTETSQGTFKVMDGTTFKGSFPASNITMNFASRNNTEVTINLDGNVLPGNLLINAGTGILKQPGTTGVGIENGTIGGNLTYLGGSGYEVLYLGLDPAGKNTAGGTNAAHHRRKRSLHPEGRQQSRDQPGR